MEYISYTILIMKDLSNNIRVLVEISSKSKDNTDSEPEFIFSDSGECLLKNYAHHCKEENMTIKI